MREYIEAHGYELLILTSHGFDNRPKLIMWVEIGPAGVHDNPMAVQASINLRGRLIKKSLSASAVMIFTDVMEYVFRTLTCK